MHEHGAGRGRRPAFLSSPATGAGSAGNNQASQEEPREHVVLRDTPSHHGVVQYNVEHKKPMGYQRKCIIFRHHTSYCCASCGENCPVHPARMRLGVQYSCLQEHREDPNFRRAQGSRCSTHAAPCASGGRSVVRRL
mmetsp:Transcript_21915/g.59135  ORF Transcript_21915/g.59135 Transcript_21915/m.59135 type:complete len:137 (-) Transcript_21915:497-907(-)